MTLILNNEEIRQALNVKDCLDVMEEAYCERASSRTVNRPTSHSYLPHSLPQTSYTFKSVNGGVKTFGLLALRVTSEIVQEQSVHNSVRLEKLPLAGKGQFVGLVQLFSIETGEIPSRSIAQIPITAKLSPPKWKDKPGSRREKGRTAIGRGCLDSPVSGGCEIL